MNDIDDLLTPKPRDPFDAEARAHLAAQSSRLIRQRRIRVYARRVMAMAACYAAGMATVLWIKSRPEAPPDLAVVERTTPPVDSTPVDPHKNDPPDRLERYASMATGERRADLYRRAGDGFLERGNERSALRCYRQFLDCSRPDDLAIRAETDSWLMMSLKLARKKEG